jgi:hypothetical protein
MTPAKFMTVFTQKGISLPYILKKLGLEVEPIREYTPKFGNKIVGYDVPESEYMNVINAVEALREFRSMRFLTTPADWSRVNEVASCFGFKINQTEAMNDAGRKYSNY